MSDNDVLSGPPSNTFDTPQKIVKKIIYAPTAASDMRYDSLAHIDYLMGGRKPDEDLMSLTSQNEYSYVSPDSPEYTGMKESLVIRARIFEAMDAYRKESQLNVMEDDSEREDTPKSGIEEKLDFIKKVPEKSGKK